VNVAGIILRVVQRAIGTQIEAAIAINTVAPMLLCRALLPQLVRQDEAHIVNVGSVFGSIGYPGFAVYSASKFAIRGFTEALRRELADTSIQVHYVAPRATGTALSTDRVRAMNAELKLAMDTPETVAAAIADALRRSRREVYLGTPERWFARLNAIVPGLIDRALRKQLPIIRRFASSKSGEVGKSNVESVNIGVLGVER
jgi:short-subunit dehydrogenase